MNGLMMDWPLLVPSILRRAGQFFPEKEIVSRWADGTLHRMTYGDLRGPGPPADERPPRAGHPARATGSRPSPGISHRHLELYFAVPSIGAVLHTINFRLSREQLLYIINHAEDRVIFVDRSVAALLAALQPELPGVERYVLMDDRCPRAARAAGAGDRLRGADGRRVGAGRVPGARREHGRGDVLHLGDDRRSQGRASTAIARPSCTRWPAAWSTPAR